MELLKKLKRLWFKISYYESLDKNRMFGKFRVLYPDGKKSQPFCWRVANDYKKIFGGKVIDNF